MGDQCEKKLLLTDKLTQKKKIHFHDEPGAFNLTKL